MYRGAKFFDGRSPLRLLCVFPLQDGFLSQTSVRYF